MGTWQRTPHWLSAPLVLFCGLLSGCGGGEGAPDPTGPRPSPLTIEAVTTVTQTATAGLSTAIPPASPTSSTDSDT